MTVDRQRVRRPGGRGLPGRDRQRRASARTSTRRRSRGCSANEIPIYEPGLEPMVRAQPGRGAARASPPTSARAVERGTGRLHRRRHAAGRGRLGRPAARARRGRGPSAQHMNEPKVVVTKSTVPVGTAEQVRAAIAARDRSRRSHVCSNPEFLKEGAAIDDFMKPDRVVVGVDTDEAREVMRGAVRALRAHRQPDPLHGHRLGRGDQVRRQRDAGDPHLVHEPDRRALRAGRRRRERRCGRGIGSDRRIGTRVPVSRARATAAPASPRTSRR